MRALRFMAVPVLAIAGIEGCKDSTPTAPASAPSEQAVTRLPGRPSAVLTLPPVGGFSSSVLSRSNFPDPIDVKFKLKHDGGTEVVNVSDPSDVVMARITIQPNSALPWHTHYGPAIASVASGALTVVDGEGCGVQFYAAGKAFVDPGNGHVHTAYNAGAVETVIYVTYLAVPAGQGPLVPVTNPGC